MFSKPRIPVRSILTEGALPSWLQRRVYRRRGYRIADDVEFAPGVVIDAEEVEIAPGTSFGFGTVIRGRRVQIGRRVDIGSFCFFEGKDLVIDDDTVFREQVFVGGPLFPDSLLEVGKRVRVFQTCFLNPSRPLRIGDDTGVGGRSSIFTHGSWQSIFEGYPVAFEPVTIGKNVWLPWHVFILPGVEIGDNATIAAGSVVNRSIPAGCLAAGVPAKVLREPDQWPRRINSAEQWVIARSMFEELLAHLEDHGVIVHRSESEGRLAATISLGRTFSRLSLVERSSRAEPDDDIVLELRTESDVRRPVGVTWFELLERRKGGPHTAVSDEVEEFINRFGIRFVPIE